MKKNFLLATAAIGLLTFNACTKDDAGHGVGT